MAIETTPCLNCEDRHLGCHGECARYAAMKEKREEVRVAMKDGRLAKEFLHDSATKTLRRNRSTRRK